MLSVDKGRGGERKYDAPDMIDGSSDLTIVCLCGCCMYYR